MKKIVELIMKILIILVICQTVNIPVVKAAGYWDETINDANKFIKNGKDEVTREAVTDDTVLKNTTDKIYNILLALGIVLSVIVGGILGIQIMWGSIEQQVKAKEILIPYVLGCFVIFGSFGLWKLAVTVFSQFST